MDLIENELKRQRISGFFTKGMLYRHLNIEKGKGKKILHNNLNKTKDV